MSRVPCYVVTEITAGDPISLIFCNCYKRMTGRFTFIKPPRSKSCLEKSSVYSAFTTGMATRKWTIQPRAVGVVGSGIGVTSLKWGHEIKFDKIYELIV